MSAKVELLTQFIPVTKYGKTGIEYILGSSNCSECTYLARLPAVPYGSLLKAINRFFTSQTL